MHISTHRARLVQDEIKIGSEPHGQEVNRYNLNICPSQFGALLHIIQQKSSSGKRHDSPVTDVPLHLRIGLLVLRRHVRSDRRLGLSLLSLFTRFALNHRLTDLLVVLMSAWSIGAPTTHIDALVGDAQFFASSNVTPGENDKTTDELRYATNGTRRLTEVALGGNPCRYP